VYDFLEFLVENTKDNQKFQDDCNKVFEKECSGYRFLNGLITPITSEDELDEIERAIQLSSDTVKTHLTQALTLLSNRQSPDFRNSIKESISAVEAQCKIICNEQTSTLTRSLEIIQRSGRVKVHPYLNEAFQKMYSWTNDDGGIRHALNNEQNIDREDAQFMLITCSAFINYLTAKKLKSSS
jgi:DNA-binding HxlR family transcriptional regulator